jgi:small conductance mechanosensitive channel
MAAERPAIIRRDETMTRNHFHKSAVGKAFAGMVALGVALAWHSSAVAQLPSLPGAAKPAATPKADPSKKPVPAKDTPGAVFSTTSGPIAVDKKVDDPAIKKTLTELLEQFPGVYKVEVGVKDGAVTLNGHVDDDDTIDDVTAFSEKVEGVRLVLNRMKTDAEVLTGREMAAKVMGQYAQVVRKNWLLAILAVGFMLAFGMLARAFARSSETLLGPFIRNPLLRSVVGSILSTLIVTGGILLGLSILNLTHAVISVLGLAGVVGLALGFAFKDIAENFIASMLLGVRRPFQIGDFITVAGKSGSVLSLNTRATLLITPEGNHVRIPNAVIYKETLVNASATPSALGSLDLMIPYEASTAEAIEAINQALQSTDGLLQEPTPRTLVNALEPGGVHLRATYWLPTRGIDGDKLQSDLRLKVKVAFQKLGIASPTSYAPTPPPKPAPVERFESLANGNGIGVGAGHGNANGTSDHHDGPEPADRPAPAVAVDQARDNLRKDSEAAETCALDHAAPEASPIDHAIKQAEANAAAEGNNMLVNAKD